MAQGQLKKLSTSKPTKGSSGITKKGARSITPKKAQLRKNAELNRKFAAGLTAQTEKMLGERAGHLEMLKGRRKKSGDAGQKGGKQGGKRNAKKG